MKQFIYILLLLFICSCTKSDSNNLMAVQDQTQLPEVHLSQGQQQLAGIKTQLVNSADLEIVSSYPAIVKLDQRNVLSEVLLFSGRITRIFKTESGTQVNKGEALYEVYSESLGVLVREAAGLKKILQENPGEEPIKSMLEGAKNRLSRAGISLEEIKDINVNTFIVKARQSGIIHQVNIRAGQQVLEGATTYQLQSHGMLQVEAEIPVAAAQKLNVGDAVLIRLPNTTPVKSTIDFILPEVESSAQILRVRVNLTNHSGAELPGSRAMLEFHLPSTQSVVIAESALIEDDHGTRVYIKTKEGVFKPVKVKSGNRTNGQVSIISGLEAGSEVVISGTYLLESELILRKGFQPGT